MITIEMQIAEAELHVAELSGPANKRGHGQSAAQLRYNASRALLATLRWCAEQERIEERQKGQ